jgi:Flp pilus assembly protein TadD
MARFEKQGPKRTKPHAAVAAPRARRAETPPSIEDTMFFPRLRRHAKWVFVFLALVFGVGFVAFGVGAGGVGVGDVFRGAGGGGVSVDSAREATEERPRDPAAWQDLVTALQATGDTVAAAEAQERLTTLQPNDADAWRQLAALRIALVGEKQTTAQIIQGNAAVNAALQNFPSLTVGGQTVLDDPIGQAINARANTDVQRLLTEAREAATGAVDAYRKIAALEPRDPSVQLELAQAAQTTGDTAAAIAAYTRFLELAPDDPSAASVKQQLRVLRGQQPSA